MLWNRVFTFLTFAILLVVAALAAVQFSAKNNSFNEGNKLEDEQKKSVKAIFGLVVICALGCLVYKLFRLPQVWIMTIVHAVVLVYPLFIMWHAHKEDLKSKTRQKYKNFLYWRIYGYQWMFFIVYGLQYIFGLQTLYVGFEDTTRRAYQLGFHIWCGVLTYFFCCITAHFEWRRLAFQYVGNYFEDHHTVMHYLLIFEICIFFILLNPYFDWRRLRVMFPCPDPMEIIPASNAEDSKKGQARSEKNPEPIAAPLPQPANPASPAKTPKTRLKTQPKK